MINYLFGRKIRLTVTITSVATGQKVDPDNLTLTIRNLKTNVRQAYVYGTDAGLAKSEVGTYYFDVIPEASGYYAYRWSCTGTIMDAVEDVYFIEPSQVITT